MKIKLIKNRSDIGAGTRGASLGISAVKIAGLDFMSNFFVHFPSEKIETENDLLFEPIQSPFAKRIHGVLNMYERVSKSVCDTIKNNFFPVVLSGDHSNAGGTIAGIKMAKPKSKLGVIWIDAHADLHTPYTTPSGNMHGMPIATAIAEDNIECKVHEVDEKTVKIWNQLKTIGKINQKVLPEDVVFISLRDFEREVGRHYAFFFGNEVDGVGQEVIDACSGAIEIEQHGTKHSLNVAVCAGVVMYGLLKIS